MPMSASLPCISAGTNGTGGIGITMPMVDSSSGAAAAAAAKPASTSAVAGRISGPPTNERRGCSLNFSRVTTPKLPPPPRRAQNRSR